MSRGKPSGITLTQNERDLVLGMVDRGDRNHDIAAYFGVNQGRIKETKDGKHGKANPAPLATLPPKGPPGLKGRRLRDAVHKITEKLSKKEVTEIEKIIDLFTKEIDKFDMDEA